MATLTIIHTTAVPPHVRGALSRWMLEPAPGLYVGTLTKKVREELWAVISASVVDGAAVLIHTAETEQRYALRTAGQRRRTPVDLDGITLIALNPYELDNESITTL